ncbi:MAG: hypothetical protein GX206_04290 [Clostridiales bacterium]|nr:hypothetical protein [Clostridiales bacterium]
MELSRFKVPKNANTFLIWALIAIIVFGFGKSSSILGLNYGNTEVNKHQSSSRKRYSGGKDSTLPAVKAGGLVPFPGPIKFNNILGGNGLFILAVVALLLLCKDDKKSKDK